jgi:hypothetical protein
VGLPNDLIAVGRPFGLEHRFRQAARNGTCARRRAVGADGPEALGAPVKADAKKWWPIAKELGIKAE